MLNKRFVESIREIDKVELEDIKDKRLSLPYWEVKKFLGVFDREARIGSENEVEFRDKGRLSKRDVLFFINKFGNPENILEENVERMWRNYICGFESKLDFFRWLINTCVASGTYEYVDDTGLVRVDYDGSLDYGVEFIFCGRVVELRDFVNSYRNYVKFIEESSKAFKLRVKKRSDNCGLHYHIITHHVFPLGVYVNLSQLVRMFSDILVWITANGEGESFTRSYNYRDFELLKSPFIDFRKYFYSVVHHYSPVSYYNKRVDGFCGYNIEFRIPDYILDPEVLTTYAILFLSLYRCAIRLSKSGVLMIKQKVIDDVRDNLGVMEESSKREIAISYESELKKSMRDRFNYMIKLLSEDIRVYDETGRTIKNLKMLFENPPVFRRSFKRFMYKFKENDVIDKLLDYEGNGSNKEEVIKEFCASNGVSRKKLMRMIRKEKLKFDRESKRFYI